MPKRNNYTLAGINFPNKTYIKEWWRTIKDTAELGTPLTGIDLAFVCDVLSKGHPDWDTKSLNMSHLMIANKAQKLDDGRYATDRCAFIVYNDGSQDDISVKWAYEKLQPNERVGEVSIDA